MMEQLADIQISQISMSGVGWDPEKKSEYYTYIYQEDTRTAPNEW